jgi:uncharacterized membrane protein
MKKILLLMMALGLAGLLSAHEGHEQAGAADKPAVAAQGQAADIALDAQKAGQKVAVDFKAMALSHLHNKIVHFPVALGLVGALFVLLGHFFKSLNPATRLLLTLAALGAMAAGWSGGLQMHEFTGGPYSDILETHMILGRITVIGLMVTAVASWFEGSRKWLWVLALALMVVISATGFYGGILAAS